MFDNNTGKTVEFSQWSGFIIWLLKLYQTPTIKPKKGEFIRFYHAPLISPAIYEKETTRANANVIRWSKWAILDIDEYHGEITDAFLGYQGIIYNTPSCKKDNLHFRLILELTREVTSEEFSQFWYALKKEFEIGDEQTKDMARMFYIPGQYPDAYSFFKTNNGNILDPDVIINKHPMPVSEHRSLLDYFGEDFQKEYLKNNLNADIKWTSYKDCPFINKELIIEYKTLTGTGWYHKLYQIMVSIASRAMLMGYPITSSEIETLIRELDSDTGNWYKTRPILKEAERAIQFAVTNHNGQ